MHISMCYKVEVKFTIQKTVAPPGELINGILYTLEASQSCKYYINKNAVYKLNSKSQNKTILT